MSTTKLYRFHWSYGRQGDVEGTFVADPKAVASAVGHEVRFGDILGENVDVRGRLDAGDFAVVTEDAAFIAKATEFGLVPSGYNPLECISQ